MQLTSEEISQIENLQKQNEQVLLELGQIEAIKLNLELRRTAAVDSLKNLRTQEEAVMQGLTEKYGVGSVDLRTGEFVPTQPPTQE
jgi:uncharacterized protein (DUF3084 family)